MPAGAVTTAALADDAVTPAKRSGGFKVGTIPASTFATTGNKTITGVGFKPKLVKFTIASPVATGAAITGSGAMTPTDQFSTTTYAGGVGFRRTSSTTHCIAVSNNDSTPLLAAYVSMNNDGFTINVVTASTLADVAYEAYA